MQLIKWKKVTFEDDIPNMKTDTNHNLLTQTIEKSNHMEYYEQIVEFISIDIEDLLKITMEKAQTFHKGIFCIKYLKSL